jgi:signal transduction histidine kinase
MRRIPRSRAFYLLASAAYAVVVYLVVQLVYQAEEIAAGLAPQREVVELLTSAFRLHLASFGLFVAFLVIAAQVAYRIASNVTSALMAEERRAADLAVVTGLSSRLAGMQDPAEIAPVAMRSVREAVAETTTVAFMHFDEEAHGFSILAEEGPGAGPIRGRLYPITVLPEEVRAQTIERRKPLVIPDTAVEASFWAMLAAKFPAVAGARTFAVLPLVSRDRLRGAITLRDPSPNALPQSRFELVTLLGHTIADALAGAANVGEATQRAEREALVNKIAQRARASLDSNEVLRRGLEDLAGALEVSRALVILGTGPDDLRVAHEWARPGIPTVGAGSQRVPLARIAARDGDTVAVKDVQTDERFVSGGRNELADLVAIGTRAAIATPIGARGQIIGVLTVHMVGAMREWAPEDCRLLEAVANELRVSMELTRLFQARQRESERMLALHHASAVLAGQTEPNVILDEILKNAVRLLGRGGASLYIWVPEAKILRNVRDYETRDHGAAKMLRSGEGVAGVAFQKVAPYIVNDYQRWEGAVKGTLAAGQRSAISVPLVRQGVPIGAITIRSYDAAVRFTDEDGHLLTLFADQAVAALTAAEAFAQQKAAVEELERLSKAKSDFISIVSHEFRTPLTGIQGFSEMIRDEDLPTADVKEYASDINKDAQRLNRMITDMLDLDRMESGRMQLYRESVDINTIVEEVIDRVRPNAPAHSVTLRLEDRLPSISADRDKITQVLTNLLSNAVKYSPDGGEIIVTTRQAKDELHVSVKDHGMGIPEDALEKVFERYSRLETGATRHIQGTGLGLPIVRQIVDMHGGRAWVESTLGKGSDFQFTLPLATVPEASEARR